MIKKIISFISSKSFLLSIIIILIGVIVLSFNLDKKSLVFGNKIVHDQDTKNYKFTNPILDCESTEQGQESVIPRSLLSNFVEQVKRDNAVDEVSFYFRDLNNGPWLGINEKNFFSPASLMKTPLLIGFLKHAEDKPELLDKKVVATDEYFTQVLKQNFSLETKIEKGKTYTLMDVARIMIIESDNVAVLMLSKYIREDDMKSLFRSVGVDVSEEFLDIDIRVKDFASFFRILYNASYLDREHSEIALEILSNSKFKNGIVAGVPSKVSVAHKYGERSLETKTPTGPIVIERQLHDCGVVYVPGRPYILCIMTKGKNFDNQQNAISRVSNFVYNRVIKSSN